MRTVTLVLVGDDGRVLGALPPFDVARPWWMEVGDVVDGARDRFGVDVTVLRLLRADRPRHPGGAVHYAVQAAPSPSGHPDASSLTPVDDALRALAESDERRRADYARPGGPQATVTWAGTALHRAGLGPLVRAQQQRTWNLSAIWRLTTPGETFWLKQVPAFFGHEGAVLRWLADAGHGVPMLVADGRDPRGGARLLMAPVEGEALYDADAQAAQAIAADMHAIQRSTDIDALLRLGVPDRRNLGPRLERVAAQYGDPRDAGLRRLVKDLPQRLARIVDCGLPETVVHGDLHGGNVIATADGRRVILDWGDCVIGNPGLDILRLTGPLPRGEAQALTEVWASWWRDAIPGADPLSAVELLRPVHELYYAAIYADFLAHIEPTEHPYHRADVDECLARAVALATPDPASP